MAIEILQIDLKTQPSRSFFLSTVEMYRNEYSISVLMWVNEFTFQGITLQT